MQRHVAPEMTKKAKKSLLSPEDEAAAAAKAAEDAAAAAKAAEGPKCAKGHTMEVSSYAGPGYTTGYSCDHCKGRSKMGHCGGSRFRWFCEICKADTCFECSPQ